MKKGVGKGLIESLPKEELRDFLPNTNIRERGLNEAFIKYAKQKDLLSNLDKKLDYHNLQAEKHPYISELRSFMQNKRSLDKQAQMEAQKGSLPILDDEDTERFQMRQRFTTT